MSSQRPLDTDTDRPDRLTDRQITRQTGRPNRSERPDRQTDRRDIQTRQTDRQKVRQTDEKKDCQTDEQTEQINRQIER